jgi:hypothetical protein
MKNFKCITLCLLCVSANGANTNGVNPETRPPTRVAGKPSLPVLGNSTVTVYASTSTTGGMTTNFYYLSPPFMPDWPSYQDSVDAACKNNKGEAVEAIFPITFWSNAIDSQVAAAMNTNASNVLVYPHYQIRVYADLRGKEIEVGRYPKDARSGDAVLPNRVALPPDAQNFIFDASCREHKQLVERKTLRVLMYSRNDEVQADVVTMTYTEAIKAVTKASIKTDEHQSGAYTVTSNSKAGSSRRGFQIGPVNVGENGGENADSLEYTDTRKRFATNSFFQNAAWSGTTDFNVVHRVESSDRRIYEASDRLFAFLQANTQEASAQFKVDKDGNWAIIVDKVKHTLSSAAVDELMTGKPTFDSANSASESGEVGFEGVKASSNTTTSGNLKNSNDIAWQRKGNDWIPISAKVRIFSLAELNKIAKVSEAVITVTRNTATIEMALEQPAKVGKEWPVWNQRLNGVMAELAQQKQTTTTLESDLKQRSRIIWKLGNNGTVSCQQYCNGSQWEGFSGECVAAIIQANTLNSCNAVPNGPTHCLCASR